MRVCLLPMSLDMRVACCYAHLLPRVHKPVRVRTRCREQGRAHHCRHRNQVYGRRRSRRAPGGCCFWSCSFGRMRAMPSTCATTTSGGCVEVDQMLESPQLWLRGCHSAPAHLMICNVLSVCRFLSIDSVAKHHHMKAQAPSQRRHCRWLSALDTLHDLCKALFMSGACKRTWKLFSSQQCGTFIEEYLLNLTD